MGVRKHGHNRRSGSSKTYMIWAEMLVRCRRLTHVRFDDYGGRGGSRLTRYT